MKSNHDSVFGLPTKHNTNPLLEAYTNFKDEPTPVIKEKNHIEVRAFNKKMEMESAWYQLHWERQREAAKIMAKNHYLHAAQVRLLALLLKTDEKIITRWMFYNHFGAEDVAEMRPLTDFFFEAGPIIYLPETKLYRSGEMGFIEFLRIDEKIRAAGGMLDSGDMLDLVLIRFQLKGKKYDESEMELHAKRKLLANIHPVLLANLATSIQNEYGGIVTAWPDVFPPRAKSPDPTQAQPQAATSQSEAWFSFIRFLSGNPRHFEDTIYLPVNTVLYELSELLKKNAKK